MSRGSSASGEDGPRRGLPGSPRARAWAACIVGLVLLAAAVYAVVRDGPALEQALVAARSAPLWMLVLVIVSPIANIAVISLSFSVLTGRYGRVGLREMTALITGAWLLNMLPLRAGMLGRVAYHKVVNGIAVRDAMKVLVQSLACAAIAIGLLLGTVLACARIGVSGVWVPVSTLAPLSVLGIATHFASRAESRSRPANQHTSTSPAPRPRELWRWPAAVALRYADLLIWVARYVLAFAVLGVPLGLVRSTVVALASEVAMLAPVQLGVREWVVGMTASLLAVPEGEPAVRLSQGVMTDLVNRGAELACAVPLGLCSVWWLYAHLRRLGQLERVREMANSR